jgi:hypothetical protein
VNQFSISFVLGTGYAMRGRAKGLTLPGPSHPPHQSRPMGMVDSKRERTHQIDIAAPKRFSFFRGRACSFASSNQSTIATRSSAIQIVVQ